MPETEFTKAIVDSGLVEKENIEKNDIKLLFEKFRVNKVNAVKIVNPIYQVSPIYPISPLPRTPSLPRNITFTNESPITQITPTFKKNYIIRRFRKNEDEEEIYVPQPIHYTQSVPKISTKIGGNLLSNNNDDIIDNNIIVAHFSISHKDLNIPIRIINSFEQTKRKSYYIKVYNELKYKNEDELKNSCQIKINGKYYQFGYGHIFTEPGIYTIEYIFNSNLTKADFLFAECYNLSLIFIYKENS